MNETNKEIKDIEKETIERYNRRFEEYGITPKSLGWDTKEHQQIRFKKLAKSINLTNKTILDIGCGFSDFYEFIFKKGIKIRGYQGIDINEKLLEVSKKMYPENKYEVKNILLEEYHERADVVISFGLLNFKLDRVDNLTYTKKMITSAWKLCNEILVIDFLSIYLTNNYPKEDFVYYHNPKNVLDICFELTDNIVVLHDYLPIPQKEFMVILKRSPWGQDDGDN